MTTTALLSFAGGIGLFLLGMRLMTDGLKLAAGNALRNILARWTGTPLRGIVAGTAITAVVQSSSAVVFATIGFVNAGLLNPTQAIGVIYGSNLGTTFTSWLVALVGFKVDMQALALPAIALGVLLRVSGGVSRRGALGDALTGLGVFFIGIATLRASFDGAADGMPLTTFADAGWLGLLAMVLAGALLTVLMQSSSASLAVTLTAVAGGLIPLDAGAAVVIGANIGTTSTGVLAAIGATPRAKRAAAAHVVFNLAAGTVALALLAPLLWIVDGVGELLDLGDSPAVLLAVFHTLINLIGVLLMWPLTGRLAAFLEARFHTIEEDEARPKYLDRTVVGTPAIAIEAVRLELARIGTLAHRAAATALKVEHRDMSLVEHDSSLIRALTLAVADFVRQAQQQEIAQDVAEAFPRVLRIGRYYESMARSAEMLVGLQRQLGAVTDGSLAHSLARFHDEAVKLLAVADPAAGMAADEVRQVLDGWEQHYQTLKAALLRAGADGKLPIEQMVLRLDYASTARRLLEQAAKAALHTQQLPDGKNAATTVADSSPAVLGEVR